MTLMSMDKLLALEMTWMRGTAMVQTLFTCLYCQRPAAIRNKTLKVYCQGVLKTCEVAKRAASRASVYEVTAAECFDRGLVDLDPDVPTTLMSMDKLLALEMTWMRGTAMVQTLFTCLYCQRPAAIRNKTLKVYCQGVLKTCEVAKRAASRASVYEVTVAEVLSPFCRCPRGARSHL